MAGFGGAEGVWISVSAVPYQYESESTFSSLWSKTVSVWVRMVSVYTCFGASQSPKWCHEPISVWTSYWYQYAMQSGVCSSFHTDISMRFSCCQYEIFMLSVWDAVSMRCCQYEIFTLISMRFSCCQYEIFMPISMRFLCWSVWDSSQKKVLNPYTLWCIPVSMILDYTWKIVHSM